MSDIQIIEPMTRTEAEACVASIKAHMSDARQKALELYQRKGWEALGYESFRACAEKEFGQSWQHVYRLKNIAEAEQELRAASPVGEPLPEQIPGRHLRALSTLPTPEQKAKAYQKAQQLAKIEGAAEVTERHVRTAVAVENTEKEVYEGKYAVLGQMVATGQLALMTANEMTQHLEKAKPKTRGLIIQLIARWGLTCAELIPELAQMFDREGTEKASKVLPVILKTGSIAGTPLVKANLTDLGRAKYEASLEHKADAVQKQIEQKPTVQPVIVTLYKGDPVRTLKELKRAGLTVADLIKLQDLIAEGV